MVECKDCNNLRKRNPGLCGALKKRVNIYEERECKYFTTEDVSELFRKEGEVSLEYFNGLTKSEVVEKIEAMKVEYGMYERFGTEDLYDEYHNESPTIKKMLAIADEIGEENITFEGFQVFPPRKDWGVDLDGFSVRVKYVNHALRISGAGGMSVLEDKGEWTRFWWD